MTTVDTIACKQCSGTMVQKRVRKASGLLGVVGMLVLLLGTLGAGVGGFMTWSRMDSPARKSLREVGKSAYQNTLDKLTAIEEGPSSLPAPLLDEFKAKKSVSLETLQTVAEPQREKVQSILAAQKVLEAAGAAGAAIRGGIDNLKAWVLLGGSLLGLVLGLALTARRNVWLCDACGALVERGWRRARQAGLAPRSPACRLWHFLWRGATLAAVLP